MFKCDKCNGTSTTSTLCENPCCPLMPCCGKKEEECFCHIIDKVEYIENLKTSLNNASHYKETSFMFLGKKVTSKRAKFVLKHLN